MSGILSGGSVQRVWAAHVGERDVILLRVRVPGETVHVIAVSGKNGAEIAIASDTAELRAALRDADDARAAKRSADLIGARIVRLGLDTVVLEREGDAPFAIVGRGARALDCVPVSVHTPAADSALVDRNALAARGPAIAEALASASIDARRDAIVRALAKSRTRLERRILAVRGDLAKIGQAQERAVSARGFVVEAAKAPRGATELTTIDWSTGEARTVTMKLDPSKSAREQIDAIFRRAKRMKEGARIGHERLAASERALAAIDEAGDAAVKATDLAALETIVTRARVAAGKDFALGAAASASKKDKRAAQAPLPPYRTFTTDAGAKILVGRGAAQNDELTLHVAKPHDLWLHAKGRTGAHVIVPLSSKTGSCPSELLVDAAHLAAHFSDAREETTVEIQHTPKRYLRKPKGSAPGLVIVDREKVLVLRKEPGRVERLLAREEG